MYNVVLIGATGLIGKQCVQIFLADDDCVSLTIIVRKSTLINHAKLKELVIDFDGLEKLKLNATENTVFVSALGTTIKQAKSEDNFKKIDFTYNLYFAQLAKQHSASKYILISSLGADKNSSNFYLKTKGELENEIEKLNFNCAYILRPSMLLGQRTEFRFGELIGKYTMKLIGFMFIGPLLKYKAIQSSKVANAVLAFSKNTETGIHVVESDGLQGY